MRIRTIFVSAFAALVSASIYAQLPVSSYLNHFHNAYLSCASTFPSYVVNGNENYPLLRAQCFRKVVDKALADLPPESPDLLASALHAVPTMTDITMQAALDAGMDVYYVVTVATKTLPEREQDIARVAFLNGADPSRTLEATAAGKNDYEPHR